MRWARTPPRSASLSTRRWLLPASYAGGAFVGQHGSWNRQPHSGYKVIFVPFVDGKPEGPPSTSDRLPERRWQGERPAGRRGGRQTGALLVADDVGNVYLAGDGAKITKGANGGKAARRDGAKAAVARRSSRRPALRLATPSEPPSLPASLIDRNHDVRPRRYRQHQPWDTLAFQRLVTLAALRHTDRFGRRHRAPRAPRATESGPSCRRAGTTSCRTASA